MNKTLTEVSQEAATTPAEETITSYKDTLIGEGKKFADEESLAKSYHHANLHLEELADDNETLRKNGKLLEEVLTELRTSDPNSEASATAEAVTTPPATTLESHVVTDDIAEIVDKAFDARATAKREEANNAETLRLLTEKYGNEQAVYKAINDTVGGNEAVKASIDALGKSDPEATVRLITNTVTPPTDPVINTPGVGGNGSAEALVASSSGLTWAACKKLRKDDPKAYNAPEFREKMNAAAAAAMARGEDFFV